jgi:predicted metalloprotease with PDZ domain
MCALLGCRAVAVAEPEGPRPIEIYVDATEAPRRLLHARLTIPATPGPLTLYYPKWIPGEHAPNGPIADLAGLTIRAAGKTVNWRRDDVDLYAFHLTVPDGVDRIEVSLDYLGPSPKDSYTACALTARLALLNWHAVVLYPKGKPVRELQARTELTLPKGWKLGTALPIESNRGATTQFRTVSLETLIDSPVLCGEHLKEVPLGGPEGRPHFLVLACEGDKGLELSAPLKKHFERLVVEGGALFKTYPYRSYRFLVVMSDNISPEGIEHRESSENRVPERFLVESSHRKQDVGWLLPHEFVHAWNGKYRRSKGLTPPDYQQPLQTRMLWVYEGLTHYLGFVLTARSGLYTADVARAKFAQVGDGLLARQGGRKWRPLVDTAVAAPNLYGARSDWARRRRGVDFYDEGAMLWFDIDTLIREKSEGKKSLDDFCRAFFHADGDPLVIKTYELDDVVKTLNEVMPYDWKAHIQRRLESIGTDAPLDGLERSGWKLEYQAKPNDFLNAQQEEDKTLDMTASIGLLLKDNGTVVDVVPERAADKARIGPGMKLIAINGRRWSSERLQDAITATRSGGKLNLLMENGDRFETYALDYADGARYPHLKRDEKKTDILGAILGIPASKKDKKE